MTQKPRGKQVNVEISPEEWVMFRLVAITERESVAALIREYFYALAAKHGIDQPANKSGKH